MIAIPVMRGRVAPVLNWCSRILILPVAPEGGEGREFWLPELGPEERLQLLQEKGVQTLICGALSADLQHQAMKLGLTVIPGVAGEVAEVLTAYRQNRLSQPEFWLPGCHGDRRYRQNLGQGKCLVGSENQGGNQVMPRGMGGRGAGQGQGQGGGSGGRCRRAAGGPGGPGAGPGAGMSEVCVCPACGAKAPHERGIPCLQLTCPQCGKSMVRG
jgi:predicted Fe-Mo cluster-binding NifX family protein